MAPLLRDLHIENFILISRADLPWEGGLTVLTGETGAGKSIVIDALSALLGGRVSAGEVIRAGADSALVEAAFNPSPITDTVLDEMGIRREDEVLILSREINRSGRSRCRINGQLATLGALQRLGEVLVDIHGQHEHRWLQSSSRQLDMLDAFDGVMTQELRERVRALAHLRAMVCRELEELVEGERDRARRLDLLQYQVEEIAAARLREGEEDELEHERGVLANAEELGAHLERAYRALYESETGSAADLVGKAVASLSEAARFDGRSAEILAALQDVEALVAEYARELRYRKEEVRFDPPRLAEVEGRLVLIGKLKSKYGSSLSDVLQFAREAEQEIERLSAGEKRRTDLQAQATRVSDELLQAAWELHDRRVEIARHLEGQVEAHLRDLGMEQARFRVQLLCREAADGIASRGMRLAVGERGFDACEFLFSANPGEDPRPLQRIASGGELSRVMLALKAVLASTYDVPTFIFDEVDAGIGGRAAKAVAAKLANLATSRQVICVTHLAQIAAAAHTHIQIDKVAEEQSTEVSLRRLSPQERVVELARMLDGTQLPTTLEHAREMLALTQKGAS